MISSNFNNVFQFYGRRVGRKLTKSNILALKESKNKFILNDNDDLKQLIQLQNLFEFKVKKIILEIGFGGGENLINSAKENPTFGYIGADPFLNTTAKLIKKLNVNKLMNIKIWPDDVRNFFSFIPNNSIYQIKILFPDPWPKNKHKARRLVQQNFIETIHKILEPNGVVTFGTDHPIMKSWILEQFQINSNFIWNVNNSLDWQTRPSDCFSTRYAEKALQEGRKSSWFIFQKN